MWTARAGVVWGGIVIVDLLAHWLFITPVKQVTMVELTNDGPSDLGRIVVACGDDEAILRGLRTHVITTATLMCDRESPLYIVYPSRVPPHADEAHKLDSNDARYPPQLIKVSLAAGRVPQCQATYWPAPKRPWWLGVLNGLALGPIFVAATVIASVENVFSGHDVRGAV